MIIVIHANNWKSLVMSFIVGLRTLADADDVSDTSEFKSIQDINESLGKNIVNLTHVYGPNVDAFRKSEKISVVKLGEFVGGEKYSDYAGYKTIGKKIEVDLSKINIIFDEKNIAPMPSGVLMPRFAIAFHYNQKKMIIIVGDSDQNKTPIDWSLLEVKSGKYAAVNKEVSNYLTELAKKLDRSIEKP